MRTLNAKDRKFICSVQIVCNNHDDNNYYDYGHFVVTSIKQIVLRS